jgi:hypothetical protein
MNRRMAIALLVAALAAGPLARAKDKKPSVPAAFGQEHTVYVESRGGQQFDRNLDPEDRETIADMQDLLKAWGRYKLVTQREDADLVFVVRKGQTANSEGGLSPNDNPNRGIGPNGSPSGGMNRGMDTNAAQVPGQQPMNTPMAASGAETGSGMDGFAAQDVLEVCQVNANGRLTRPLWTRSLAGGLSGPHVMLFQQLRVEVEKAYPAQPADQAPAKQ